MILRILAASFVALGLGLIVEEGHAGETVLCKDGRIVSLDAAARAGGDPCRLARLEKVRPPQSVPLPVKRPSRVISVELKGPAEEKRGTSPDESFQQAAADYRRVRIINARPGGRAWYQHNR
jgi:hypothetical protein